MAPLGALAWLALAAGLGAVLLGWYTWGLVLFTFTVVLAVMLLIGPLD